jgi:hypothetical protein
MAGIENRQRGQTEPQVSSARQAAAAREPDALYQRGRVVARVGQAEIDLAAKELRIGEIYKSDELLIPEECEFQQYRILIQRIAFAAKIDKAEMDKGRILRGVTADILGYREQ